jgi:hypothetical protein
MVQQPFTSKRQQKKISARPPCCYFTVYKNIILTQVHILCEVYYRTPSQRPRVSDTREAPTSIVRATATLLLIISDYQRDKIEGDICGLEE